MVRKKLYVGLLFSFFLSSCGLLCASEPALNSSINQDNSSLSQTGSLSGEYVAIRMPQKGENYYNGDVSESKNPYNPLNSDLFKWLGKMFLGQR